MHLDSDQLRADLLTRFDQFLGKAVDDKSLGLIQAMLKDVHLVFREYAEKRTQAEYFESYQVFTLQLQKRLTATKLLSVMSSKDWRVFDSYLVHIKQIGTIVESSANYFSKSGLLNGLLK